MTFISILNNRPRPINHLISRSCIPWRSGYKNIKIGEYLLKSGAGVENFYILWFVKGKKKASVNYIRAKPIQFQIRRVTSLYFW